jgi:hypothetical protein
MQSTTGEVKRKLTTAAFRFVLIIGIVNLFADFTYEGGRSIMGPFLGTLGASGATVGFVAGFGELMGYGLRSVAGYIGDKTHKYWAMTIFGYCVNMLAVPALALAGSWPAAAALMILERTGRAFRRPNVETMLTYTTKEMGRENTSSVRTQEHWSQHGNARLVEPRRSALHGGRPRAHAYGLG